MTQEDIFKLAQESYERGQADLMKSCEEASIKAIEVAVAAEREACAKLVEESEVRWLTLLADAIRARGEA